MVLEIEKLSFPIEILLAACKRFAMVRNSDNGVVYMAINSTTQRIEK